VGRTSVETVGEAVVGEDPTTLSEAVVVEAWRQTQRSGRAQHGPGGGRRGTGGGPGGGRGGDQQGSSGGPDGGR
jgi:hypothetical protein